MRLKPNAETQLKRERLAVVKRMPPLRHSIPGEEFDISHSQVVKWLLSQPAVQQEFFDMVRDLKSIVYDSETKMWHGADYGKPIEKDWDAEDF